MRRDVSHVAVDLTLWPMIRVSFRNQNTRQDHTGNQMVKDLLDKLVNDCKNFA